MGGDTSFESRLDYIFQPNTSQTNLGANGLGITTIMNIGNEPDFATPYLYHYINKQWKSVIQSRALARQLYVPPLTMPSSASSSTSERMLTVHLNSFKPTPSGIPGNSDSGALNSWLIWQMLGLYPIVTQPVYLLSSPWFPEINITVNGNRTLRITAQGLGEESYYVQGVSLNGEEWGKNWFAHDDVMAEGGTIAFVLGEEERVWEWEEGPPSPGHVELGGMERDEKR